MEQKGLNRSLLGDFSDFVIVAVLILVVMEYTQWDNVSVFDHDTIIVLILVVMEYTQWEFN